MANTNYTEELDKLYTAIDVINKFESGDSIELKRNIRAEIARIEKVQEELEELSNGK